jgi:hypothetical protein
MKPGSKRQDTTANPTAPGETLLLLIEVMLFGMLCPLPAKAHNYTLAIERHNVF